MSALPVFVLLGLGAWALAKNKPATAVQSKAASEVPADANSMLATMLAPSLVSLDTLKQIYASFMTAAENQYDANKASAAPARLAQYALATFLKAAMLSKGAQPDTNELLMIAYAPTSGGAGLIGYGDVGVDVQAAIAAALAPGYSDLNGVGTYIGGLAQLYNTTQPGPARKRLLAYILAAKAKQIALRNPVQFPDANQFDAPMYFAVANIPAASLPATTSPNSILAY
jgi:hypothetical protein